MIDKYLKLLASKIDDRVSQLQMSIADGKAEDFAEYRKMCGEVKGLLTARLYIIDLQERVLTMTMTSEISNLDITKAVDLSKILNKTRGEG